MSWQRRDSRSFLSFVPDRGFDGVDKRGASGRDTGPVAFEHEENFDPFQIDKFLDKLKEGDKKRQQSSENDDNRKKRK
jgi:hypothetical protein